MDFWLLLLSWMFISSYATIPFIFHKQIYFFECLYFSKYNICMYLCFLDEKGVIN